MWVVVLGGGEFGVVGNCRLILVGASTFAVAAHDALAADHGVCNVLGAEAWRQAGLLAHGA